MSRKLLCFNVSGGRTKSFEMKVLLKTGAIKPKNMGKKSPAIRASCCNMHKAF